MLDRCYNIHADQYKHYGARGIGACDKWQKNYDAFYEDMGPRPKGKTLERVNGNKEYCPENCRWATQREQTRNKRIHRILTLNGVSKPHFEWAEIFGMSWENLRGYVRRYGEEKALSLLISRMEF